MERWADTADVRCLISKAVRLLFGRCRSYGRQREWAYNQIPLALYKGS